MFNKTISSAVTSLAPFWSNNIVQLFALGNEYTMVINMILTETISYSSEYLTDTISMILMMATIGMFLVYRFELMPNIKLFSDSGQTMTTYGTEITENGSTYLKASNIFKAVNAMLIKKYNIKKTRYVCNDGIDAIVDNMNKYKLENDLYVTVNNCASDKTKICITLSSKKRDINEIIKNAVSEYLYSEKTYKITLTGKEEGYTYYYPITMIYITYVLTNVYKMKNLIVMTSSTLNIEQDSKEIKSVTKTKDEKTTETIVKTRSDLKNIFLLESIKDFNIENDLYITIERTNGIVKYILTSGNDDIKDFITKCIDIYEKDTKKPKYNYTLKLSGYEKLGTNWSNYYIKYPTNLLALCDTLIRKHNINNFRIVDLGNDITVKIVDELQDIVVDDIRINTSKNIQSHDESTIWTTFTLESNNVDIYKYIENITDEYNAMQIQKGKSDTIYYFKYIGKQDDGLKFNSRVLSNKQNQSYETFDNIYSEHTDMFVRDIKRLKNLEYYKKSGMRRKKSYLLHGEPGCGKNAFITAIALYDKRHILDIPFDLVKTNSEFDELLNITTINGITFKKDQLIIIFDEMHVGIDKLCKNEPSYNNFSYNGYSSTKIEKFDTPVINFKDDALNIGCVLSMLDGMGNYGGVIIAGITNYIDKIPLPLRRSLRLTPIYVTYMRSLDVCNLIENSFEVKLTQEQKDRIPDRAITPAKLRVLCENNEECKDMDCLINIIIDETTNEKKLIY